MLRLGVRAIKFFLLLATLFLIAPQGVYADGVIYTLVGSTNPEFGSVHTESFQFTAPGFITTYIGLSVNQLDSCVACAQSGTAVEFYPNNTVDTIIPVDFIRFTDGDGIVYGFFFDPGDFSAVGTYSASGFSPYIVSNVGTLTVQVATPEPSSLWLFASGLFCLVGVGHARKSVRPGVQRLHSKTEI